MIRVITLFFSMLWLDALGCVLPVHGPEYDALIDITKNDKDGSYHVEVPKKLKNTEAARVHLIYSKSGGRKNGVADISRELDFGFSWKVIKGDFVAAKKEGYVPYIHVVWPGEVCSTVANAKIPNGAEQMLNNLFQYIPAPSVPPSDSLDAAPPQAAAEQGRYLCKLPMKMKEAQSLVESELEKLKDKYDPIDCAVIEEETIEKPWGWVFFYQSKPFIETGDFRDMLGGNAPIIVNRSSGELIHTGTAYDIEHYVKEYEAGLQPDK